MAEVLTNPVIAGKSVCVELDPKVSERLGVRDYRHRPPATHPRMSQNLVWRRRSECPLPSTDRGERTIFDEPPKIF